MATPPISAIIGGVACDIVHGTLNGQSQIGQRGQLTFDVLDPSANFAFTEGSAAQIVDATGTLILSRWVTNSKRLRSSQAGMLYHQLTCTDNCYLADKRVAAATYTSQTAQYIFNDLLANILASEGVYAVRNLLSVNQSDVETDTTGFSNRGTGVTLSRDTSQHWHGAASLKAVCDGSVISQGFFCLVVSTAYQPGMNYQASLYMRGSGTVGIQVIQQSPTIILGQTTITLTSAWQRVSVPFVTPNPLVATNYGLRVGTTTASAVTYWADGLQIEPNPTNYNGPQPWETGQTSTIGGSEYTIGSFVSNYAQVSACYDAITQKAQGYSWWIDDFRRAYFLKANPTAAPVTQIDDTIIERDTEYVQHGNTQYRNTQYLLGGTIQTGTQTDTRIGDSHTKAFLLGYEMSNQAPTVTVGGVAQTVGILNIDTGKQWYYQQGSNVLTQDSSGTALTSAQTLQVVYVGQYPNTTTTQDGTGVAARQIREGGSTSGIVESVAVNTTLSTAADALQEANGYLARYNQDTQELDFMTQTAGFQVGQSVPANIPGLKLSSVPMLIESVTLTDQGPAGSEMGAIYYTVVALQGPPSQKGARFWLSLLRQATQTQIDSINVGQSGTVVIPQSGTVAFSWTLTGSAALLNLLFPSSSHYPSPTQYPGGSSGGSVALTWEKTNAGLNAIRDAISGAHGAPVLSSPTGYLAWGTGTPPSGPTATQLGNEVGRKSVASVTNGASVGEELIAAAIGPNDGVGAVITEVAIFYDATESGTANTGVMMLYASYSHTHTNAESITITADSTLS